MLPIWHKCYAIMWLMGAKKTWAAMHQLEEHWGWHGEWKRIGWVGKWVETHGADSDCCHPKILRYGQSLSLWPLTKTYICTLMKYIWWMQPWGNAQLGRNKIGKESLWRIAFFRGKKMKYPPPPSKIPTSPCFFFPSFFLFSASQAPCKLMEGEGLL